MHSRRPTSRLIGLLLAAAPVILLPAPASAQSTMRVSVDSSGLEANRDSNTHSISADGRFVAFASSATNLVTGDTNGFRDIYVHDRLTGQTTRASVDSAGMQGDDYSDSPSISADGRYVAFFSKATNLVAGDSNGFGDIFVHDRQIGQTTLVSVDSSGVQGNGISYYNPSISADGGFVAFMSTATNLCIGDTNGSQDIFVHARQTGQTSRVSVDSAGVQGNSHSYDYPSISADGRFVAFYSESSNLVAGDTNIRYDVFVHDLQTGTTTRASVNSAGVQGNSYSYFPSISSDGNYVSFTSLSSNLVPSDTNSGNDVFIHDRRTGQIRRVSVDSAGIQGNGFNHSSSISGNGRYVVFHSDSTNLVLGDTNASRDVFVHDCLNGLTTRVSESSAGVQGDGESSYPSCSADGRYIAFQSNAKNLVLADTNASSDVFVRDSGTAVIRLTKTGVCPGAIDATIVNATPHGAVAILTGPAGPFVKPTPPCQGLSLGLSPPTLRSLLTADAAGVIHFVTNVPPSVCGLALQAVDVTTCTASNAVVL